MDRWTHTWTDRHTHTHSLTHSLSQSLFLSQDRTYTHAHTALRLHVRTPTMPQKDNDCKAFFGRCHCALTRPTSWWWRQGWGVARASASSTASVSRRGRRTSWRKPGPFSSTALPLSSWHLTRRDRYSFLCTHWWKGVGGWGEGVVTKMPHCFSCVIVEVKLGEHVLTYMTTHQEQFNCSLCVIV